MSVRIVVDSRRADALMEHLRDIPEAYERFLADAEDLVWRELSSRVPVKTGTLLTSMRTTRTPSGFNVTFDAPYAPFVEAGTQPHFIYPRSARALKFEVAGKTVFAAYVFHPGFSGRWFVRDTKETITEPLVQLALETITRVIFGE